MTNSLFKVIAVFEGADGKPLHGDGYKVTVRDQDRFLDDKLGESDLDDQGEADFLISVADVMSFDSLGERTPDIYFVLTLDGKEVFRSDVFPEVDFEAVNDVTGRADALTQSFGPFRIG